MYLPKIHDFGHLFGSQNGHPKYGPQMAKTGYAHVPAKQAPKVGYHQMGFNRHTGVPAQTLQNRSQNGSKMDPKIHLKYTVFGPFLDPFLGPQMVKTRNANVPARGTAYLGI